MDTSPRKEKMTPFTGTQMRTWQALASEITNIHFETLCDIHARSFFQDEEEVASYKAINLERAKDEFDSSVVRRLKYFTDDLEQTNLFTLLAEAIRDYKTLKSSEFGLLAQIPYTPYSAHINIHAEGLMRNVKAVFTNDGEKIENQYAVLLDLIANSMQDTVITAPQWLDNREGKISSQVEQALENLLKTIYNIRLKITDTISAQSAYKKGASDLYSEIFDVENHIWLPMQPPLTAPLDGDYLKEIYAREEGTAKRLAQQIVKSDGIILISGYRGVGKSTFLNAALSKHVPEVVKDQLEEAQVQVVRVQVNAAKASNIENILRLCIRELHRIKKRNKDEIPFTKEESTLIDMANLRTVYRVKASQAEIMSQAGEVKTFLGIDPGAVFSKLMSPLKLPFPTFNLSYTENETWQNQFDKSISLLDYDEDRAEEDLIHLAELTCAHRKNKEGKNVRLKLVFVFDELDKIPAPKQNQIVSRLKNLFLTPNSVFILVTSKDFYYLLEEERKKEDSLLGSYFSAVVTVPLFSAAETESLIRNLLSIPIYSEDEIKADPSLVRYKKVNEYLELLAKYLTYQSFGLPREVVRLLRENQQWKEIGLQPYITDNTFDRNEVRIFGKMQYVIEQILSTESSLTGETNPPAGNTEHDLWLNDIRREQVRRGLYVLLDELRLQGLFQVEMQKELSAKSSPLRDIYNNNFKGLPYNRFLFLLQNLGRKLAEISDERGVLFKYETLGETGEDFRISVRSEFYAATNTQVSHMALEDTETRELTPEDSLKMAQAVLEKESTYQGLRSLLLYLKRCIKPLPMDVQRGVYQTMLFHEAPERNQLIHYLSPGELFKGNQDWGKSFEWLKSEYSETIVNAALDWSTGGAEKLSDPVRLGILRNILLRPKNTPATRTRAVVTLAEIVSGGKANSTDGLLKDVVVSLDKENDIPRELLGSLLEIARQSPEHLVDVIIDAGLSAVSIETFQTILRDQPYPNPETLWQSPLSDSTSTQRLLAALLLQFAETTNEFPESLQAWLQKSEWTENELAVLREAGNFNKSLFNVLKKNVKTTRASLLNAAIGELRSQASKPATPKAQPVTKQPSAENSSSSNTAGFSLLFSIAVFLGMVVWIYISPVDSDPAATAFSKFVSRTVELLYLFLYVAAIIFTVLGFSARRETDGRYTSTITIIVGVILGIGASLGLWWRIAQSTAPITLGGQLTILGFEVLAVLVPIVTYFILAGLQGLRTRK